MVKIGIIGLSEGNGHPFSFSAICNGYSEEGFSESGWPGIHSYLKRKDSSEFKSIGARVTHVWTQDAATSEKLKKACLIKHSVTNYKEMLGQVDAVIIARDDFQSHFEMAKPFLEAGVHVFVDKPLTLDLQELSWYEPYLHNGLLMSCSGFRFCFELDSVRAELSTLGNIKLIQANVINGWDKYGIHMIDAIFSVIDSLPVYIESVDVPGHESINIVLECGTVLQINALGPEIVTFAITIYADRQCQAFEIKDNFQAFKRTLFRFVRQVEFSDVAVLAEQTIVSIKTLIAGRMAIDTGERIYFREL